MGSNACLQSKTAMGNKMVVFRLSGNVARIFVFMIRLQVLATLTLIMLYNIRYPAVLSSARSSLAQADVRRAVVLCSARVSGLA